MNESQLLMTRTEVSALDQEFRAIAHKVANWITVVKALSTLAKENPAAYEKLIKAKLMTSPEIAHQIHRFADELYKRMNPLIPMPQNLFWDRVQRVDEPRAESAVIAA